MFRPRYAYKSPITNRYRGKAKGCPVFNNLNEINSNMVEQHDECLECLSKIKNRIDLYRTLADDNKPNNNVIKSLQRLSSSASNNRLKTCLQFLIIKVNEKTISPPQHITNPANGSNASNNIDNTSNDDIDSPTLIDIKESNCHLRHNHETQHALKALVSSKNHQNKRQRLHNDADQQRRQQNLKHNLKHNHLASPPQDQVSSTQDQVGPSLDDHDCQTSPMMLITAQEDGVVDVDQLRRLAKKLQQSPPSEANNEGQRNFPAQTQSSPTNNYGLTTTTTPASTTTTSTSTSPSQIEVVEGLNTPNCSANSGSSSSSSSSNSSTSCISNSIIIDSKHPLDRQHVASNKRRKIINNSDHDTSSTASRSSPSYTSPLSPISTSSTSSISSSSSHSSSSTSTSSSLSPCSSSPISSPDMVNELKGPRLKLSEEKIRKIKKRPLLFDDDYYIENSFASTPTTSSGCSPGQHSNTTQNSDQSRFGLSSNNTVIHMFQAPPKFVNNLKPCNLPTKTPEPSPPITSHVPTKEMLNCAICGIKDKPPNINKIYGQNSCLLCTRFFVTFLKRPQQLYCAQDGDCIMAFDSRCQACWIKICLQKFDIEEENRKIGQKFSPKLLSSPNVSLITIDTSLTR